MVYTGPEQLKKSNIIKKVEDLPRGWKLSFKLFPFSIVGDLSSVLHATIGNNDGSNGDRIPGIWLRPNRELYICSSINGNANFCFFTKTELPLFNHSTVVVQQVQSPINYQYYFQVYVNGKRILDNLNEKPMGFKNVNYFASDPWFIPAKAILTDFDLVTYKHKGIDLIFQRSHHIIFQCWIYAFFLHDDKVA